MRVAVVSSFPPDRCGVAAYASQQSSKLREAGHDVVELDLSRFRAGWSARDADAWRSEAQAADRILLHYERGLLWMPSPRWTYGLWKGHATLRRVLAGQQAKVEVIVHEPPQRGLAGIARLVALAAARHLLAQCTLVFHTQGEADRFSREAFRPHAVRVQRHEDALRPMAILSRAEARARLGLPADAPLALCIGFYHPEKGYEECLDAFLGLARRGALPAKAALHLVVSLRNPRYQTAYDALAARATPPAVWHADYVPDEDFDAWLQASNVVAVPYKASSTSGVLARATLLGVPTIVADVGGLAEQAGPLSTVYKDRVELEQALLQALRTPSME